MLAVKDPSDEMPAKSSWGPKQSFSTFYFLNLIIWIYFLTINLIILLIGEGVRICVCIDEDACICVCKLINIIINVNFISYMQYIIRNNRITEYINIYK